MDINKGYDGDVVINLDKACVISRLVIVCKSAVGLSPPAVLCRDWTVKSAILRRESRGAHFRSDFPETKDEWKKSIVMGKNKIEFEAR